MNIAKPFNTNLIKSNVVSMSPTNSIVNTTGVTVNSTMPKPPTVIIKTQNNNIISTATSAAVTKPNQIFSIAKSIFYFMYI